MKSNVHTVAVIGGGPAGATAARVLAETGTTVILIDARPRDGFLGGESLVPAARVILDELGLWERFRADGHLPCYGNISVWGTDIPVDTDFIRSPHGHGWHLDRSIFDTMLCGAARESGAELLRPARLIRCERESSAWRLTIATEDGPETLFCEWILDCTGRNARVARHLGVERIHEDGLLAFHARFRPAEAEEIDEDSRTLVESAPSGWFHTALLPSRERVVTFFTDAGTPWVRAATDREGFLGLLGETIHVRGKLEEHRYTMLDDPISTDARTSRLEQLHGDGWIAAGDAATAFDPLSSQGILSALYSGLKAGNALAEFIGGEGTALAGYDATVINVYDRFLENRLRFYAQERRWPESPFWRARGMRSEGVTTDSAR